MELQITEREMTKFTDPDQLRRIYSLSKYARLIAWMVEIDEETVMKEKPLKLSQL
jgi:hypothetical protein